MCMDRTELLQKAIKTVTGDREQDYGSPENNFSTIAAMWSEYLSIGAERFIEISPTDVASMMILLKIARIASGHAKEDNWIDIAGYAACGGEIEGKYNEISDAGNQQDNG